MLFLHSFLKVCGFFKYGSRVSFLPHSVQYFHESCSYIRLGKGQPAILYENVSYIFYYLSERLHKTSIIHARSRKQTDAAYSSSSFARAASSSSLFSNLNQRSSATRGKREGNTVENVAMLNNLNYFV